MAAVAVQSLSPVWLSATPWTAAHQTTLFMGFSRQEYWRIPFSSGSSQPRHQTWVSCIAGGFFTVWVTGEPPGKPLMKCQGLVKYGDWVSSGCNKNLNTYFIKRKKKTQHLFYTKDSWKEALSELELKQKHRTRPNTELSLHPSTIKPNIKW